MIGVKLKGRLGNQMFQYAAAMSAARRLGCGLLCAGTTSSRRNGVIGTVLGLDRVRGRENLRANGILRDAFGCGPGLLGGRTIECVEPLLKKIVFSHIFSPQREELFKNYWVERYNDSFQKVNKWTWLNGYFQSENYFNYIKDDIISIFSPRDKYRFTINKIISELNINNNASRSVGIHVRRGDYLNIEDRISGSDGWALPIDYYNSCIENVDSPDRFFIFSDDPDWAEKEFSWLNPVVFRGNHEVVDLILLSRMNYVISANSSFSWWAGYLAAACGSEVFAPKFHLGWRKGVWVPSGIQTNGWHYINVR